METKKIKVHTNYINEDAILKFGTYSNGSVAIQGVTEEGEPLFRATVALDVMPSDGCVFLKGWSENEGIPEALVKAGIVELTGRTEVTGYCEALEARLVK